MFPIRSNDLDLHRLLLIKNRELEGAETVRRSGHEGIQNAAADVVHFRNNIADQGGWL